jgi:hypothetical protein
MVQRAQDAGFVLKTEKTIGIVRNRRGQDFDGDRAVKPRIAGAVDLAHAAGTDRRLNFIRSKPGARGQRHAWVHYKRNNSREMHLGELVAGRHAEVYSRNFCWQFLIRTQFLRMDRSYSRMTSYPEIIRSAKSGLHVGVVPRTRARSPIRGNRHEFVC